MEQAQANTVEVADPLFLFSQPSLSRTSADAVERGRPYTPQSRFGAELPLSAFTDPRTTPAQSIAAVVHELTAQCSIWEQPGALTRVVLHGRRARGRARG